MIWQRPAAAKKIPNATVPQPKFVNLKLLNCYNNAAIKNHLPLIYIYDILLLLWYQYFLDTSTTTSNSKQVSLWSWDLGEFNDPSHAREVCSRSVVHQKGRQHQCVLSIWSRLNPSSQPGDDQPIFLAKLLPFSSEMIKIYVSKTTWSTTSIFGSVSSFLTGHWPHLLMFLNVLDGFFHKFEPGLGLSPALKDVENRLNVNRGFPERPVTPQHSNTPNLSKG